MADPAQAANTTAAPAGTPSPPVLGGPCTDVDKVAYDSTANEQVVCEGNTWDKAPVDHRACTPSGTLVRPTDVPVFTMSKSERRIPASQCDPAPGSWTRHS